MITKEQITRFKYELRDTIWEFTEKARAAELALEAETYRSAPHYSPDRQHKALEVFQYADYMVESRSLALNLVERMDSIPHDAICFFKEGDKWQAVYRNFRNLQESPAGFGETLEEALNDLRQTATKIG